MIVTTVVGTFVSGDTVTGGTSSPTGTIDVLIVIEVY